VERALRAFADNPTNRDVLLAQTAFQVAELHGQMLAAFAAISQGGLGGLKDLIGGSLFGRKGK
jgi:hypothetical protein